MYLDVLLETLQNSFDVLFVQEPPWRTIRQAPSPNNRDGEDIVGAPMHPAWLYMVRPPTNDETPRVMAFVSKRLERLRPSMRRDLADHRDIFILSLFQGNKTYHLMNVYNDADGTAVRYLSNHVHELPQLHYMGGDFNIHTAIHPAGRVTAPDAELFAICSAVCLAVQQDNCERIVVFTDLLTSAKRAVDPTLHSSQGHSLAVCRALEPWLAEDADCSITFIQVPSKLKWKIHQEAQDECRAFNAPAVQHPSTSLDSVRRAVTKSVQEDWKTLFRDPDYRGHNFLMLQQPDETVLEPSYINGGTWLPAAGGDLHLAVRICRCILNHAPIGAYYERFNIPERTSCTCKDHPLETCDHILRHCGQYQRDEDGPPPRYYLGLVRFLEQNEATFSFRRPQGVG
ncbi:hypothetical protein D9613_001563 [Agrocybe pediades]|uniref:Endonuclease/exonuclease/phosphatase domain-containing protein n=1 Tax=Agrocybe pediades TaxID=84607 RepID=A0A8H4R5L4_9AGAR|nr:hypothetical protein D9613_001563 [Agrocybe pediades]